MAAPMKSRPVLNTNEVLALLNDSDSSGSGTELDDTDGQAQDDKPTRFTKRKPPASWTESEHDDSDFDKDYKPEEDDPPDTDSDYSPPDNLMDNLVENIDEDTRSAAVVAATPASPKRHKRPTPHKWKRQVLKEKRLKGEGYQNVKRQEKQPKTMGPPCTSQHCARSKQRSCELLSDDERTAIFNKFWSMSNWETRKVFTRALVNNVPIKQKKAGVASRRTRSQLYHLQLADGRKLPVCKKLFSSTLGISPRTIGSWLSEDKENNTIAQPKINKTGPHVPISAADKTFLDEWLAGIPTVPSHYCRHVPSYQNKKFLEPGTVQSHLYKEYRNAAGESGVRIVSETYFRYEFSEQNYSVFVPRNDQCDVCVGAKVGNVDQATLTAHRKLKDQARAKKAKDKQESGDKLSVWTMDLQCVLLSPKTKASTMYYKTKLQMHNFTCYNLGNRDGYCYPWEEHEGSLGGEVFAHLQFSHFKSVIESNPNIEKIIIWSDGCGYQNRNSTITNAYLDLAIKHGVTIEQKYLVAGHTQMECDTMHSLIERHIVKDIHTPRDYVVIFEASRLNPSPYHVKQLYHDDFMKLGGTYIANIRPGRKVGDPTVHDLRALQYSPDGTIRFKIDFEVDWEVLPQRVTIPKEPFQWVRLFQGQLPITFRKFNDLQSMKPVLPRDAHHYYDNLPHCEK